MTRAATSTNTPSVLMDREELAEFVEAEMQLTNDEKAACVGAWQRAMEVPLAACASCGQRKPPPLDGVAALEGRASEHSRRAAPRNDDPTADDDASWAHLEVAAGALCDAHPAVPSLYGYDVCLLGSAYPTFALQSGSVGWRAQVRRQQATGTRRLVNLFGTWFDLHGPHVRPIQQLHRGAPPRAAPARPAVSRAEAYSWHRVGALEVLRMTAAEEAEWERARERLDGMPVLGADGRADGVADLSRLRSLYSAPAGGAPFFLHPELVDVRGDEPMCLLCAKCTSAVRQGTRPPFNVANVDYGSMARVPQLAPLSMLEEMLLSPHRLYHVVIKVRPGGAFCLAGRRRRGEPPWPSARRPQWAGPSPAARGAATALATAACSFSTLWASPGQLHGLLGHRPRRGDVGLRRGVPSRPSGRRHAHCHRTAGRRRPRGYP